MSDDRVEKVRAISPAPGTDLKELFGAPGAYGMGGLVADDATLRMEAGGVAMGGVGPEAFYARWADWLEAWESYRIYPEEFAERGDCVEARARLVGVTKHGGVELESWGRATFCFDGDRVTELTFSIEREATP